MRSRHLVPVVILLSMSVAGALLAVQSDVAKQPEVPYRPAIKMRDGKVDERLVKNHALFLERIQQGPIGLLMIGDSITAGWHRHRDLLDQRLGQHRPALFAISGDRTQHVLWRLQNGELEIDPSPKLVVLMIGANNICSDDAGDIDLGIQAIFNMVRSRHPSTKVLMLSILPMGANPADSIIIAKRKKIAKVNAAIASYADGADVRYLDLGPLFLNEDGSPNEGMRADAVHLEAAGYQIWLDAMAPVVMEMIGQGESAN